jgi:hypothetical protein
MSDLRLLWRRLVLPAWIDRWPVTSLQGRLLQPVGPLIEHGAPTGRCLLEPLTHTCCSGIRAGRSAIVAGQLKATATWSKFQ